LQESLDFPIQPGRAIEIELEGTAPRGRSHAPDDSATITLSGSGSPSWASSKMPVGTAISFTRPRSSFLTSAITTSR
jgi:hypothetical protein